MGWWGGWETWAALEEGGEELEAVAVLGRSRCVGTVAGSSYEGRAGKEATVCLPATPPSRRCQSVTDLRDKMSRSRCRGSAELSAGFCRTPPDSGFVTFYAVILTRPDLMEQWTTGSFTGSPLGIVVRPCALLVDLIGPGFLMSMSVAANDSARVFGKERAPQSIHEKQWLTSVFEL